MAGCASKNGTSASAEPTAKPSPTLAPKEALLASTKSLTTSSYKFTIKSAYANVSGAADPTNKLAKMTAAEGSLRKVDFIQIGTELYVKLNLGTLGSQPGIQSDKYYHTEVSKLGANKNLPFGVNGQPFDPNGTLTGLNDVQSSDGTHFTSTVDATKMTGVVSVGDDAVLNAGDKAKSVPFAATLDDLGRLTDLSVNGGSIDRQLAFEVTTTDYGTATGVTKPDSSQVVEATDPDLKSLWG